MGQALCLLHANCQGDCLRPLLENSPAFARHFYIRQYVNYTRQGIEAADLENCALFLYQKLAPRWGDLSSEHLLRRLPASCQTLEIPNLFFKGYWPFWQHGDHINFEDSLLEALLNQGLDAAQAMALYLRGDAALLGTAAALAAQAEKSIAREEEKEARSLVRCAPLLREHWQEEQLFITVNHPGRRLLFYLADSILRLLGLGGLPDAVRAAYQHPQEDFWLPIHPRVGAALGLPFAFAKRQYPVYHTKLTHQQYVGCYLACRQHRVTDLVTFLRNLSPEALAELG